MTREIFRVPHSLDEIKALAEKWPMRFRRFDNDVHNVAKKVWEQNGWEKVALNLRDDAAFERRSIRAILDRRNETKVDSETGIAAIAYLVSEGRRVGATA